VIQLKSESAALIAGKTARSASTPASSRVRCFACNHFGHAREQCPNRLSQPQTETSRKLLTSARLLAPSAR
jgi:hypothetical protein